MALINLLPSMLSISLCFNFLLYSCSDPTKIFSNAEYFDGYNSTIKGMFVFGDSFVDTGNNNFLETIAKADYLPYGIDFPHGPSGRFCNGKTFIDVLGDMLNITTFIPAFHDPSKKKNHTVVGVSYASGASGILNETSSATGGVLSLNEQIKKFEEVTLPELQDEGESSRESLSKYLFVIGCGSNDYVLNYFMNGSQSNVSVEEFTTNLTTTLSSELKKLYNLGAQKFVLLSLYDMGCSPLGKDAQPKRKGCNKSYNKAARLFNANLRSLVKGIRPQKPGPKLVMVNAYNIVRDIIRNPALNGFTDVTGSCCQVPLKGEGEFGILCQKGGTTCEDRKKHVYFDTFHPTEAVNVILAAKGFSSNLASDVYPFSIKKLAQM